MDLHPGMVVRELAEGVLKGLGSGGRSREGVVLVLDDLHVAAGVEGQHEVPHEWVREALAKGRFAVGVGQWVELKVEGARREGGVCAKLLGPLLVIALVF